MYATVSRKANLKAQTGPNITFDVTLGGKYYFLLDDEIAGPILITVRKLSRPVEDDENGWSETIEFSHVYTSSEALKCCDVLHSDRYGNIGKLELRPLVDKKTQTKSAHMCITEKTLHSKPTSERLLGLSAGFLEPI